MLPFPATPVAPFLRTSCVAEPYQIRPFLYRSYIVLIYFLYAVYKKYMRTIWELYKNDIRRAEFGAYWVLVGGRVFLLSIRGWMQGGSVADSALGGVCVKKIYLVYIIKISLCR